MYCPACDIHTSHEVSQWPSPIFNTCSSTTFCNKLDFDINPVLSLECVLLCWGWVGSLHFTAHYSFSGLWDSFTVLFQTVVPALSLSCWSTVGIPVSEDNIWTLPSLPVSRECCSGWVDSWEKECYLWPMGSLIYSGPREKMMESAGRDAANQLSLWTPFQCFLGHSQGGRQALLRAEQQCQSICLTICVSHLYSCLLL
jgi:hypothetical protein